MRRLACALWLALGAHAAWALPTYEQVRRDHHPSDTLLLSREGEVLHRLRTDTSVRRGAWVALADVSPALRLAIVVSEDRRFHEHSGIDWRAVSSAAWGNLWNTRTRAVRRAGCWNRRGPLEVIAWPHQNPKPRPANPRPPRRRG